MGLKKRVIQFKDGEQIAVFDSATAAANAIGSTKRQISACCTGRVKSVNGYVFQYTGEFTNQQKYDGEYKCPYCDMGFDTYNGLCKHVIRNKAHGDGISKEKLLADFKYNGVRPVCKCGCGEYTDISYQDGAHFVDYKLGHASRIHNNWGHNEKAKEHSAETRRRQYQSEGRIQWNKGKSWEETFTPEHIESLMEMYNEERSAKISKALKGRSMNEEVLKKMKERMNRPEYVEFYRDLMHMRLSSGEFSISSKIEKRFIDECIKPLGIEYNTQYYIKELRHYCDVYIPSKNTIVEFNGDYWHGNPKKYTRDELSEYQLKKVKKDEELRKYCSENNINLIEVWESDFNKDKNGVKMMLSESISI